MDDREDSDISLPKSTIVKHIKEVLPQDVRCAGDSTELLLECCTEFVQLVSTEANEAAAKDGKATITPEHVLSALDKAGFGDLVPEVRLAWEAFKDDAKQGPKLAHRKTKAEEEGMSEEQQIALQQQLFAAARMRSQNMDAAAAAAVAAAYGQGSAFGPAAGAAPE